MHFHRSRLHRLLLYFRLLRMLQLPPLPMLL
jgi:hypothetical protein